MAYCVGVSDDKANIMEDVAANRGTIRREEMRNIYSETYNFESLKILINYPIKDYINKILNQKSIHRKFN